MNTKSFKAFTQVMEGIIKYFKWVVFFAAALIVLSGIYRIESNEVAIVLRFGRLVGNTQEEQVKKPGIHLAFPFFIDNVIKIPVQTVHETEIITHYGASGGAIVADVEKNAYVVTGDNNIALIKAIVKYQIKDAAQYAIYTNNVRRMIDGIISGELTRRVTHMDIDTVLTSGRVELSNVITRNSQMILDALSTGIAITNIELTDIVPPTETAVHFAEVRNAAVIKETRIQQAKERASTVILSAEAEASANKQTAISDQNVRLTKVHNEMADFNGIYDQYVKNPQIIMAGTFRQRVGAILAKAGSSIIVPEGSESPVILLPRRR